MNREQFNEELHELLHSKELFDLLPECGWLDGGCRSLMKAFQLWLGNRFAKPWQIVKRHDQEHSEHAVISVGNFFLDADGLSTFDELKHRWLYVEHFPAVYIRPFNPTNEPPCEYSGIEPLYISDDSIMKIVDALDKVFDKDEVLDLLFL